jgi:hypothetical protein
LSIISVARKGMVRYAPTATATIPHKAESGNKGARTTAKSEIIRIGGIRIGFHVIRCNFHLPFSSLEQVTDGF